VSPKISLGDDGPPALRGAWSGDGHDADQGAFPARPGGVVMRMRAARRRLLDGSWDAGCDVLEEVFAADHRYHDPVLGDLPTGPAGVRTALDALLGGLPDASLTLDDVVESEHRMVVRWTLSGTHLGELWGLAPSGRHAVMRGTHVFRFRRDRIAETWASYDALGLLDQLGLVTLGIAL